MVTALASTLLAHAAFAIASSATATPFYREGTISPRKADQMTFIQRLFARKYRDRGQQLLIKIALGSTLKSHRDLEGNKQYLLHHLDGTNDPIEDAIVEHLKQQHAIDSNKKFPAETYILTQHGLDTAAKLTQSDPLPLSSRNV